MIFVLEPGGVVIGLSVDIEIVLLRSLSGV